MRWFLVITAVALAVTGSASAELVARVPDGMIAVTPTGKALVGFVRGQELVIAQRTGRERWTQRRVTRVSKGSRLAAFKAGAAEPVAVIIGPGDRSLIVVRRKGDRWLRTALGGPLGAGRGGFPIGAMFAVPGRGSIVYAAWTEEFPGSLFGGFPVTLATHGREITENIVSERGVTTGLAMTSRGPELAANEWVAADNFSFSFPAPDAVWAGTVTGSGGSELDGRLAGLAAVPHRGAQDLLLSRPDGLWGFRSRSLPVHVSLSAEPQGDGTVALSGRVQGAHGGHVTIYREHAKTRRETAGTVKPGAGGTFALVDTPRARPVFYRAVYTDPATGIPYAKLMRDAV